MRRPAREVRSDIVFDPEWAGRYGPSPIALAAQLAGPAADGADDDAISTVAPPAPTKRPPQDAADIDDDDEPATEPGDDSLDHTHAARPKRFHAYAVQP